MGTCRCLRRRWSCSPQLLVTLLLDPDGRLKSAEGTLRSHSLLMGDPVFRAQSFYSFGITGAVPWNSVGRMVELLTPKACFPIPILHLVLAWIAAWLGVMVSLSGSLAVLGIELRASCLLDKHFTIELHYQLPYSFLTLRQSLN